ncbi:MAG: hypothetical protein HY518_05640 [Candidatus Aenigmarchaeota archaeon]|nr:hypothetical protein [Candidatus Aenigmarchaeota archaeon]
MKLSRHDMKELRREERKEGRKQEADKQDKAKRKGRILTWLVFILIVAGIGYGGYGFFTSPVTGNSVDMDYIREQALAFPDGFTHQHADLDIVLCGVEQNLPGAPLNGQIGPSELHTHDSVTNQRSLVNSDGNGVIHTEGNVRNSPEAHTIGRFLEHMGIAFSETSIMNYKDGDICQLSGEAGSVSATLNDNPLEKWINYLPKDGDIIVISFGQAPAEQ